MSHAVSTARILYRLLVKQPVSDKEFDQCRANVFDFGGINDREIAQNNRKEFINALRQQQRMPDVIRRWDKTFRQDAEISDAEATHFIQNVWEAIDELNMWFMQSVSGGTLRYTRGSVNDIHHHLTKIRPFWSLSLTVEGSGRYNCIRQELHSQPGDLVLFSPAALIDICRNDNCKRWVHHNINFTVHSDWLTWLQWPEIGPNIYHLVVGNDANMKKLTSLFKEIINTDHKKNAVAEILKRNLLEQILIRCHELALQKKGKPIDARIRKIAAYINDNFEKNLTIDELSDLGGLSRSRLSILFKQEMGASILQWRNEQRMAHACRLLVETTLQLGSVAEKVGYQDPMYFGRCFRQHLGCSPSRYREQRRKVLTS